jgi:molybdenum cofactor guanylyltransferase
VRGSGPAPDFDTIVLAGGRAARLDGADKPGLAVAGVPMVAAVAGAAVAAGTHVLVLVGPPRAELDRVAARLVCVTEDPPFGGPVPALRRGLAEVSAPLVAVLAADLPFLQAGDLSALLEPVAAGSAAGAVLADDEGRPQWLAGCWITERLSGALAGYQGRSMHGLLTGLQPRQIRLSRPAGQPPPWLDCDTREELALARALAAKPDTTGDR